MNAGISAARSMNRYRSSLEGRQRILEYTLNRRAFGLALPAYELRAVVLDCELQRSQMVLDPGLTMESPFAQSGQASGE